MPVRTPILIEIDKCTWLIQEYGIDCCYALLGEKSGLLIDVGCGRMDIKSLAERLFGGRRYDVVLTHGHSRHAGGALQFNSVYCSDELCPPLVDERVSADFAPPVYSQKAVNTQLLPIYTGDVFELGGRDVLCVRTPGHSKGSCSFFDRKTKIAFVGDACGREMKLECASDALTGLMLLKKLSAGLSRIYCGHTDYTDYRALPPKLLDNAIGACRAALSPDSEHYRKDGKLVFNSVALSCERAWAPMEPHSPYPPGL